jgi:hypothetical protein
VWPVLLNANNTQLGHLLSNLGMGRLGRVWAVDNLSFKKGRKQTKKKKKKKKKKPPFRENDA